MALSPQTRPQKEFGPRDPYWELVQRVSSSTALRNSPRLLQLFHYLCERAVSAPGSVISEQQVGVEVFGRGPGYNSDGDTIVRTQISHLRKRLLQYFFTEGSNEPITIEVPIGSYLPVFLPRKEPELQLKEARNGGPAITLEPAPRPRKRAYAFWGLVAVLALLSVWLAWQNSRLRAERVVSASRSPYLDHMWKQLLDNGRPSYIVTSDANAMFFSDLMDKPIALDEYRDPDYPNGLLQKWVKDPQSRRVLKHYMNTYFTTSQDGFAVARFTNMGERYRAPTTVIYARDFRRDPPTTNPANNLILLGHRKANLWVGLFDSQLNFRYEWRLEARKGFLHNRNPKAGESETYEWNVPFNSTYATVAYVPTRAGTVLLVGGSDMTAVDAGSRFLCDEEAVHKLHTALGIDSAQRVPYFEALIAARRASNVGYDPQLISVRLLEHSPQ